MQFKIGENLPYEAAEMLTRAGHNAMTVPEEGLSGATDARIASISQRERRAILTLDVDFADIRTYPPARYPDLIVLRLQRQDKHYVLGMLARVIETLGQEPLEKRLWIVEDGRVRVRV